MVPRVITTVHYTSDFQKSYKSLPTHLQRLVDKKDALFRTHAFHPSLETHKLSGPLEPSWSFSVNKKYRVLFRFINDHSVMCYDVGTHDIYR